MPVLLGGVARVLLSANRLEGNYANGLLTFLRIPPNLRTEHSRGYGKHQRSIINAAGIIPRALILTVS